MKKLTLILLFLCTCFAVKAQTLNLPFVNLKATSPIYYKGVSNLVINGDSIVGGTTPCIYLISCTNVHITHCKLLNSTDYGIYLNNCSNVLIDSNYVYNVRAGVYVEACPNGRIRTMYNEMKNVIGPFPHADFVQYNRVNGANNRICHNRLENITGQSAPEDAINLYMCNGLPNDPILVEYNAIRGGGPSTTGSGITVGDNGGSYQTIAGNVVVNPGYAGIQVAGGNHIAIVSNSIYSASLPWSGCGLGSSNYSGVPSNNNTVSNNKINWIAGHLGGQRRDTAYKAGTGANINAMPTGWKTNIVNAPISTSILPAVIVNVK